MNTCRPLLLIMILAVLSGCVSKPVEKEYTPPPLMIAQNSDGDVAIAWESDPDYFYTIYYQNKSGDDWIPLKKAQRVPGTGQTLTVYDRVNPNRPLRRYRIVSERNSIL